MAPEGDSSEEAAYATNIEEAFIEERGTPFLLSPKDWLLIRGWREAGIPVDTVIRAVRETFAKRRARGQAGKINSISYCENAVQEQWEMERRGLVGKADAAGRAEEKPEEIAEKLQRLIRLLVEAARQTPTGIERALFQRKINGACEKLRALAPDAGFDTLEANLSRLESSLIRSLEKALEPGVLAAVEASVTFALGDTAGVSASIVDRMRRALTRREVRKLLGLPSLTLFDV